MKGGEGGTEAHRYINVLGSCMCMCIMAARVPVLGGFGKLVHDLWCLFLLSHSRALYAATVILVRIGAKAQATH